MIPFIDLKAQQARIRDDVDKRLANVLDHGAYIMGPEVKELEAELGKWSRTKHVISAIWHRRACTGSFGQKTAPRTRCDLSLLPLRQHLKLWLC